MCLIFALLISVVAFAAVQESSYLNAYYADVTRQGGGVVSVDFGVLATHTMSKLGIYKIAVYRSSGSLVKSIYSTTAGYSDLLTQNTSNYFHSVNVSLTSGVTYYMVITFYAKDSNGSGSANYTTGTFTA